MRISFGGFAVSNGKGLNFGSECHPVSRSQRSKSRAMERFTRPRHAVSGRVQRRGPFDTKPLCAMPTMPSQTALEQCSDPKPRSGYDAPSFTAQPSKQECRCSTEPATRSSTQSVQRSITYSDHSSFEILRSEILRRTEASQEVWKVMRVE